MPVNVLNIPGDYYITANNGLIQVKAGQSVTNQAGSYLLNTAGAYLRNNAGSFLENNASTSLTNTAGTSLTNTAGTNLTNVASLVLANSAGTNLTNNAGGNIVNVAVANITNQAGGNLTNQVTGNFDNTISGNFNNVITGSILNLSNNNITNNALGNISNVGQNFSVYADVIQLGENSADLINPVGLFNNNLIPDVDVTYDFGTNLISWRKVYAEESYLKGTDNVDNPYLRPYNPADIYGTAVQRQAGAFYVAGGVGIEKDLNVGGFIYGRVETANTSLSINVTATNVDQVFYSTFAVNTGNQFLFIDNAGPFGGFTYNPSEGKLTVDRARIAQTDNSVSTMTGAFTITGGVGIGKDVYVGGNILPGAVNTGSIGKQDLEWYQGYIDNLYTKVIGSTASNLTVAPGGGVTDIFGDIRVRGTSPIGTAPVVRNTLYVTMDGNDTNDGRAMDASRACRTIGGALRSPYYQEGTQILVSAGHYLEDNPLPMKRYTSIRGSDIRTTFIEPINKTQDLFHVNSGCYLNYMTFLNGRSGLLEGPYEQGFNRGAYCTAFPPLSGDDRITLNQSPYIQNCTNQSGPWLKDGTMFIPNQTIQVPAAVGTGTWAANTTQIVVSVSTGTIELGMTINAGNQNPGFYDARTLLLANKGFIQEQVVTFVDQTFNSGNFSYDAIKCARDTGLIVESIAIDLLQNSDSDSIFAGLQYWRQDGFVDAIGNQITTTTNAIAYLRNITSATVATSTEKGIVFNRFNDILDVLNSGTTYTIELQNGTFSEWITNKIQSNYTGTTASSYLAAANAIISNKTTLTNQTISYIQSTAPTFAFNTSTCRRDIGFILDSVVFDLLHGGNKQSIKSGVYYFQYTTGTSEVVAEVPQVQAAYRFMKGLVQNVVKGNVVVTKYQNTITQSVAGFNSATIYEADALADKIDIITGIIRDGPEDYYAVGKRIPILLTSNSSTAVQNAYNLLLANKQFIVAETIAYINSTSNFFDYNREKCRRDVGILVENIAYDATFGGNQKAVESGLAYFDGVISKISGQETQTISAIDYLAGLAQKIIINDPCTDLLSGTGTYAQVINTALIGGGIAFDSIENLKNIITTIIDNGPDAAPAVYTSPGPDSAFVSAEILIQANRKFIQQETVNYINHVIIPATNPGYFPYSEIKCRRDTGLIIDSFAQDLLYYTNSHSQSTFAGLQYWGQDFYVGDIADQLNPTVEAIKYLKATAVKIIQNITPNDDLIARYQTVVAQNTTTYQAATLNEAAIISARFDEIIDIVSGNKTGWTDRIISNATASNIVSTINAYNNLLLHKNYLASEINAFVTATNFGFVYDAIKCGRDVGYMVDAVAFDLLHGGNRQSVQNGLYYYGFSTTSTNIYNETTQTVAAFNHLASIAGQVVRNQTVTARQTEVVQVFTTSTGTTSEATAITISVNTITNIITNGPGVAASPSAIAMTASSTATVIAAYDLLYANKSFLIEETIAYIDQTFNSGKFNYNEAKCFRDVGLILDAVTQDILLGGNSKSVEAGLSYWSNGYNSVSGQETTTTLALNRARDVALLVAANQTVTVTTGTIIPQIINTFFDYGYEYGPQEGITRNFGIINRIIENGPAYAPPVFKGGGLFSLVGINGADVNITPKVVSVVQTGTNFRIGLDIPTIGFGTNATLYFGDTEIYPLRDYQVDELSFERTGNTSTWALRKIDQFGGMGGALIDGAVIADNSPIQSFVFDAYTQLTQGGRGVHIKNDGYAQLVSVFTIFSSIGVEVESGGIASIVNSNANFGNICLQANGFGRRKFTGHIYNPPYKAYPESPVGLVGSEGLNQYYPSGFWPNNAQVMVFLPDTADRPHISLVMEVVPPETVRDFTGQLTAQLNEQGFPGFLNANPTTGTLTTSTITLTGISTDGIFVGNAVYARDQFGRSTSTNLDVNGNYIQYIASGTVVTALGFNSITLNKPVQAGGSDPTNTANSYNANYFDLYFCGNAYYTVLSSELGNNPQYNTINQVIPDGENILSTASLGLSVGQLPAHIQAMRHLNTITNLIVSNSIIPASSAGTVKIYQTGTNTTTQYSNLLLQDGSQAITFINLRFNDMINIIAAPNLSSAENVVRQNNRNTTGPAVQGAGAAVSLIENNIEFLADEVAAFVAYYNYGPGGSGFSSYSTSVREQISVKCQRDVKIILQRLIYDIESGGNYNMVMSGLSYWRRTGTYHIVSLGEGVTRTDLFPDGATVNFYQRSYMSASGYVFEYVGAGIDYGALPQRGVADPQQSREVVQLNAGKVFFTSTDQNGDFRIGPGLVISQATGVLSGRTFTRSLFANLTPFILAIEAGG